ncbi:MAG: ribonuclease HII [Desulfovibrionaceae bacterium]|nr:ribonuclease HII [Desulfovibrionaceae bacterium]MBF0512786.1 ribonuclease HII [Desulfovibrionaceae bacterium]
MAGLDEAGRGCLAGPVVAAAVILPDYYELAGLADSKTLSPERRELLAGYIRREAVAFAYGLVWPGRIDAINILQASLLAMAKAVARLKTSPATLYIDGDKTIPGEHLAGLSLRPRQQAIVDGDSLVPAISAASILAKTYRDRLMGVLDRRHPGYGFAAHKGYGVKEHLDALRRLGPCPQHRLTFKGVLEEQKAGPPKAGEQACLPGI